MSTSICSYRKASNAWTEIVMSLPDNQGADDETRATELCTLDGITYVAVPDSMTLPEQPPELTIEPVTLTPELKTAIRNASPHCAFIDERRQQMLRSKYSADDEAYMSRISQKALLSGAGAAAIHADVLAKMRAYDAHAEACIAWAKGERAKLGL